MWASLNKVALKLKNIQISSFEKLSTAPYSKENI